MCIRDSFSAFWKGMVFFVLMFMAYFVSTFGLGDAMAYPSIFAFGLVAFGMLGMGPVSYTHLDVYKRQIFYYFTVGMYNYPIV